MIDRELPALRAELAALRAQLARHEAQLGATPARGRGGRARAPRRRGIAALVGGLLILVMLLSPLGLLAAGFTDLNPGSPHNGNIAAIADAGITKGCFDTAHYCPNDLVTREQLASSLARTAGLGVNPPVANAAQLGGVPASGYLRPVGAMSYNVTPATMYPVFPTLTKFSTINSGGARISSTTEGDHPAVLPLPVPGEIFGTPLAVAAVQVCYRAEPGAYIGETELRYAHIGTYKVAFTDATHRVSTSTTCYSVADPTPEAISGNPTLAFRLHIGSNAPDVIITQVVVTLVPAP